MIDFSAPDAWKRPFKNAKKLLLGRGVQGVLSVMYLAMATRTLGVEGFGVLTLITSTVGLVGTLASFQPAQFILRYGAQAITNKDATHFKKIFRFGIILEFLAAIAAVAIILLLTKPLVTLFSIDPFYIDLIRVYAFVLPFILVSGVAMGALQLIDRHDLISWQLTAGPVIKFVGAAILFFIGGGVAGFLVVWFISVVVGALILSIFAWRNIKIHLQGLRKEQAEVKHIAAGRCGAPEKGMWNYLWSTSLHGAMSVDLAPMLTASVLGPEAVGLLKIAQRIGGFIGAPVVKVLTPALYTDMTWLNTQGNTKQRRKMVVKVGAVTGFATLGVVLLLAVIGKEVISLVAGVEFVGAYGAMMWISFSAIISSFCLALTPLAFTGGRVWQYNFSNLIGLAVFAIVIVYLTQNFGVTGAGGALFIRNLVFSGLVAFFVRDLIKK